MMNENHDTNHSECTLSDTDLFSPAFTQSDLQHGCYQDVFPNSQLDDHGPVEFVIRNSSDKFIDLANTTLKLKIQIKKSDGTDLGDADVVGSLNYIIGSMFNQVEVSLGNTLISLSNNMFAIRAYLEMILNHGSDAKNSQLQMGLYRKDNGIEELDLAKNEAFKENVSYFKKGQVVEVSGKIHSDILHQGRLIPK